jgi:hypothetical protein
MQKANLYKKKLKVTLKTKTTTHSKNDNKNFKALKIRVGRVNRNTGIYVALELQALFRYDRH